MKEASVEFPGNGGRVVTRLRLSRKAADLIEVFVRYGGKSFTSSAGEPSALGEEHELSGGPVECSLESMRRLSNGLNEWLNNGTLFEWCDGSDHGPRLAISLCRPDDVITTRQKPALAFRYVNGGFFSGTWKCVVDRTCLEPAQAALTAFLVDGDEH